MNVGARTLVEPRADKHCHHGPHGEARRAHYVVERECEVCEQQSGQDKGHEIARIGECYLIGPEPAEHGIHECCKQPYVDYADRESECQRVAEHFSRGFRLACTEQQAHACRGSGADESAERGGDVHYRESDGESGDCLRADHLTNKNAVDHVVEHHHEHSYNRRKRILPQ